IDLGPEGGERGGGIVAAGTPEQVAAAAGSYTGEFLQRVLNGVKAGAQRGTTRVGGGDLLTASFARSLPVLPPDPPSARSTSRTTRAPGPRRRFGTSRSPAR